MSLYSITVVYVDCFELYQLFSSHSAIRFKSELHTIEFSSEDKVCKPLLCTVIGTGLRSAPTVGWYRADGVNNHFDLTGQWRHINSEYWQERLLYPTSVKCKEKDGEYDCSLQNDYYCRAEYLGLYQCRVTNTDDGTEIKQEIIFQSKLYVHVCEMVSSVVSLLCT